jgi:hypothetical protein
MRWGAQVHRPVRAEEAHQLVGIVGVAAWGPQFPSVRGFRSPHRAYIAIPQGQAVSRFPKGVGRGSQGGQKTPLDPPACGAPARCCWHRSRSHRRCRTEAAGPPPGRGAGPSFSAHHH